MAGLCLPSAHLASASGQAVTEYRVQTGRTLPDASTYAHCLQPMLLMGVLSRKRCMEVQIGKCSVLSYVSTALHAAYRLLLFCPRRFLLHVTSFLSHLFTHKTQWNPQALKHPLMCWAEA